MPFHIYMSLIRYNLLNKIYKMATCKHNILLLCALVVFTICHSTSGQEGTRCTTQAECPDGLCCVHNPLTKPETRKRFLFETYTQHDHGFCRRARQFNETCWPLGHDGKNAQLFEFFCPCVSGLECRGLVVHESNHQIIHRYPKCQTPESNLIDNGQTPSGTECMSDSECGSGMCCVSYPMDKRSQSQGHHGYCRNERKLNETCDLQDTLTHDFQCQCQAGLECRGTQVHHFGQQTVHVNTVCQKPLSG
ncbi:uncharacterized protein LOC132746521 [Ruditapes philippinarum]|uniref:uncharacterized protein LOC132746521 n=1 Tax=Ruditapes philippinarum TaxID=129788 RepID=UPI00295B222F|nr:uncharacterized protein LOC132746521 [Ruditapes philippinarum]